MISHLPVNLATLLIIKEIRCVFFAGPCYICPYCGMTITEKGDGSTLIDTITKHLATHRNEFFQCFICNKFFNTESEIMNHMLLDHPNQMIKIYHNSPSTSISNTIEIITSHIECGVCSAEMSTPHLALHHFATFHLYREFQMRAIQVVKRMINGAAPNWSIGEKKWPLNPVMICLRCRFTALTVTDMVKHHSDKHLLTFIALAITNTLTIVPDIIEPKFKELNSDIVFCCMHCQDEIKVPKLYSSAKDVYAHWNDEHTKKDDPLSFRFYVEKLTACFYCNIIGTYQGLRKHFQEIHPNTPFAIVNITDRTKCGICDRFDGRIDEHFQKKHNILVQLNIFNPFRLTDACFNELLAINIHMKYKCVYPECNKVFDSKNALQKHKIDIHNDGSHHSYCQTFRDLSIQTFVDCCKIFLSSTEYLKHLNDHRMQYDCGVCEFSSDEISIISHHEHTVHGIVNAFKQRYLDYLNVAHTNYWRTKILFGNGLVLHKYNLLSSKQYNDRKEYDAMINAKMEIEHRTYVERVKQGQMSESTLSRQSTPDNEILIIE